MRSRLRHVRRQRIVERARQRDDVLHRVGLHARLETLLGAGAGLEILAIDLAARPDRARHQLGAVAAAGAHIEHRHAGLHAGERQAASPDRGAGRSAGRRRRDRARRRSRRSPAPTMAPAPRPATQTASATIACQQHSAFAIIAWSRRLLAGREAPIKAFALLRHVEQELRRRKARPVFLLQALAQLDEALARPSCRCRTACRRRTAQSRSPGSSRRRPRARRSARPPRSSARSPAPAWRADGP